MITLLYRIIKNGWQIVWRNRLVSVVTIAVIMIALFNFSFIVIFHNITKTAIKSLEDKIDISVYFAKDTSELDIFNIKKSLESLSEVARVEYVSSDEALKRLMEKYGKNEIIIKSLEVLESNPLQPSLNVKAKDSSRYNAIAEYLNNPEIQKSVIKINYAQNKSIIERLSKIVDAARSIEIILGIVLSLIAGIVVFNTIRLVIHLSRDQLEIMRLVGAFNIFTRGPYIVAAILYGIGAGIFSFVIVLAAMYYTAPFIKVFIPEMDLWNYMKANFFLMFGLQVILGVLLAAISSFIATRKYLKI